MFMPIDLNAAGKDELMQLQEVSERAAERVVEYRAQNGRFESVEELAGQVTVGPRSMADCHRRWLNRGPV
jgi:competence protein ComEA